MARSGEELYGKKAGKNIYRFSFDMDIISGQVNWVILVIVKLNTMSEATDSSESST